MSGTCVKYSRWKVFGVLGILIGLTSCQQTKGNKGSDVKFDWENGLGPLETKTGVAPVEDANKIDSKFCKGLKPGTCFSLIIRIPKAELVQDIGLSTLALASGSKNMRTRLDEACQASWNEYKGKYAFDSLHPLRSRFVKNIQKMRCIFLYMGEEYSQEDSQLADNEVAFSSRLTKFEVGGEESTFDVRLLGLNVKKTFVQTSFRNQAIFSGKAVSPQAAGWQAAQGFGVEPVMVKNKIERDIKWKVDLEALKANLEKVATDAPGVEAAAASFFGQAKAAVAGVAAASQPATASLLLVGMGYNAFKAICGEAQDKCKHTSTQTSSTPAISEDLADLVPSSETNELYRLALIRGLQSVMDKLLVDTEGKQLSEKFGVK